MLRRKGILKSGRWSATHWAGPFSSRTSAPESLSKAASIWPSCSTISSAEAGGDIKTAILQITPTINIRAGRDRHIAIEFILRTDLLRQSRAPLLVDITSGMFVALVTTRNNRNQFYGRMRFLENEMAHTKLQMHRLAIDYVFRRNQ